MKSATPSEPFCCVLPGNGGQIEHGAGQPYFDANAFQMVGAWFCRYRENCAEVPEPSERTTGVIVVCSICMPGLSASISGFCHVVMTPVKIFPAASASSRRLLIRTPSGESMLYINEV